MTVTLTPGRMTLAAWREVADGAPVRLDPAAMPAVEAGARAVDAIIAKGEPGIERYLEAAKLVADHAVIGAGPLEFYSDPGKTGLELSALARINELYEAKGFRVVSGEGGRPFGLERYSKALYVAWYYKHRVALGDPGATIRGLAAKEGLTGRVADHVWMVLNKPNTAYPTREGHSQGLHK